MVGGLFYTFLNGFCQGNMGTLTPEPLIIVAMKAVLLSV